MPQNSGYSFDEKYVQPKAECLNTSKVSLNNGKGSTDAFVRQVGLCWIGPGTNHRRCVTKGKQENTIYHYDYDSTVIRCSNPTEMSYTFSAYSEKEKTKSAKKSGGFFSFLSCFKFW